MKRTIIVLLILAGVSLNAIIGDNGVITNAMSATILQSCSVLEEYLKEDYVSVVGSKQDENFDNSNVSLTPLEEMLKFRQNYFFKNGTYDYVIYEYEHDGKVDYLKIRLINKQNLSDEIKSQLKGGDANGNNRESYLLFEDVFGVTDDLKVFYCSDGLEKSIGANFLNSSIFDSTKVLYSKTSPASKALAESYSIEERDLTISDLRSVNQLTISGQSGATDLKFLIDMPNITKLTLKDYNGSLSGIENLIDLTYLLIDNYENKTNINYEGLSGTTKLSELDFYMPTDDEVEKMCQEMSKSDYKELKTIKLSGYIGLINNGNTAYIESLVTSKEALGSRSELSSLESLDILSNETKQAVKKLYINNNKLTDLVGIEDFTEVTHIYLQNNRVMVKDEKSNVQNENLSISVKIGKCLTDIKNLTRLFCGFCNIQDDDFKNLSANTNIEYLSIPRKYFNNGFKYIEGLNEYKRTTSNR